MLSRRQSAAGATTGVAEIQKDTDKHIAALNQAVAEHKAEVVKTLLDIVCSVRVEVHENFLR